MSTPTYTLINQITLAAASSTVTISSIPQNYKDLVLNVAGEPTSGGGGVFRFRINGDSGSSYSIVTAEGNGSSAQSGSLTTTQFNLSFHRSTVIDGFFNPHIIQLMDYSAIDKHKGILARANASSNGVIMTAGRYASNNAVSSLLIFPESGSWDIGSTFSLYGIVG